MDGSRDAASQHNARVAFVADLVCPWCHIALHTLLPLLPRLGIELAWHPFLLDPGMTPAGIPRTIYLERRFGSLDAARAVQERIQRRGRELGLVFAFERIRRQPETSTAHALLLAAPAERRLGLARALFRAFFEEGADLGDVECLEELARASGCAPELARGARSADRLAAVRALHRRAVDAGIDGVPALLVPAVGVLAGAQPAEVFERFLELAVLFGRSSVPAQGRQAS